jgi:hypothetical protein
MVDYSEGADAMPRDIHCQNGQGCTYLKDQGYFQDKVDNYGWKGSNFSRSSFQFSSKTPPFSLFNPLTARESSTATLRDDLYTIKSRTVAAGGGNSSFNPSMLKSSSKGVLFFDHTRKPTPFNFSNDFTVGWLVFCLPFF